MLLPLLGDFTFPAIARNCHCDCETRHCERSEAKKTCLIAEAGQREGFFLGQTIV